MLQRDRTRPSKHVFLACRGVGTTACPWMGTLRIPPLSPFSLTAPLPSQHESVSILGWLISVPPHQALAGVLVLSVEKIRALGFKGPPPGSRVNSSPLTAQSPPAPPKRHPELGESPLSQMKPRRFAGSLPLNVTHPSTPAGTFQVHAHRQVFPNCSNSFLVSISASSPSPPGAKGFWTSHSIFTGS